MLQHSSVLEVRRVGTNRKLTELFCDNKAECSVSARLNALEVNALCTGWRELLLTQRERDKRLSHGLAAYIDNSAANSALRRAW